MSSAPTTRRDLRARPRRRASALGIAGEVLITVGVVALLYVVWQLWLGDVIIGSQQRAVAESISEEWAADAAATPEPTPSATASAPPPPPPATADPVVLSEAGDGEIFALMRVPRFGADYQVPIAGGVSRARTLDPIGIGHYPGTPMPGDMGNVALAGHRGGNGAPFHRIADLRVGDAVVIETPDGWYTYRFRSVEYVPPTAVDVLLPVPRQDGSQPEGRYLTMTSCSPIDGSAERIIAYSVFESFTPRTSGPPVSLTAGAA